MKTLFYILGLLAIGYMAAHVLWLIIGEFLEWSDRRSGEDDQDEQPAVTYRGKYNPRKRYRKNNVVKIRAGNTWRVFLCRIDAPAGLAPEYPENAYWALWSFGPMEYGPSQDGALNPS